MPDLRRASCQHCHRHRSVCGPISWAGLCEECGIRRVTENLTALDTHAGPGFLRWRERMAASVGAELLDADRSEAHTR